MSIIRKKRHDRNYVILDKRFLTDERLPWDARGVLAYLLSLPDGWEIQVAHLATLGNLKRDGIQRVLRDLEAAGYLVRYRLRRPDGTFEWIREAHEEPQPATPVMAAPSTAEAVTYRDSNSPRKNGKAKKGYDEAARNEQIRRSAERLGVDIGSGDDR